MEIPGPSSVMVGFFEPNDQDPSAFSRVWMMNLFLGPGLETGFGFDWTIELGRQTLRTDSLVPREAS